MRYALLLCFALLPLPVAAQTVISGRLHYPKFPGGEERTPLTAINLFAAHERPSAEPVAFRSWEMAPSGWYKLSGREGRYAIFAGTPGHYIRPVLLHNIYAAGEVHKDISPRFDYALFDDSDYDRKAAAAYYQPFVAQGTSVTSVGFRLVHDGVDGAGPGAQNVVVSIHRVSDEAPEKWKQIGPTALAVDVDCGGPKTYAYSVGWNSGEVRLEPGQRYAVRIAAEKEGAPVQTHWKQVEGLPGCVRIDRDGKAATQEHALWLAIGTDGDGLVIPYNKRVHKQFVELTTCQPKWSQTYVARGKSLAAVQLYAAVSGAQPSMNRQRVTVRVRAGGPDGKQVGVERLAIGNAIYTGDASWGAFGAVFLPGEVPLTPGKTYAIDWESAESFETLHGFVNIKNQVSDGRPGLNPYKKHPRDAYEQGTAYLAGKELDYDLDAQIIEYENAEKDEPRAVSGNNLLAHGDFQQGEWQSFALVADTVTQMVEDRERKGNRFARVIGGSFNKRPCDGGFVQQVEGLSRGETYILTARVRSTWPASDRCQCHVGYDLTGQTDDPAAKSIVWSLLPERHGVWVDFASEPLRPSKDGRISVWLRGKTTLSDDYEFRADFDDVEVRKVRTVVDQIRLQQGDDS